MPKEYISAEPQERGSVKVAWGRDSGHIQVAVAGPVGWRDSLLPRAGQRAAEKVDGLRDDLVDPDNALDWHFSPNRFEINKLIRVLRTARDQAFGRDE